MHHMVACPAADSMWTAVALDGGGLHHKRDVYIRATALFYAVGLLPLHASATPHTGMALLHGVALLDDLYRRCRCCLTDLHQGRRPSLTCPHDPCSLFALQNKCTI